MSNYNKVILMGRLTRDPELRYTPSGTAVAKLGLAVTNRFKQGDEWKEEPCFVDISVFGRQGENCSEYLSKGSLVLVDGHLSYRKWETEDGQTRSKLEVISFNVQFMPRGTSSSGGEAAPRSKGAPADTDSDVPF
jgi:single-strand DNA-binding protein